MYVVNILIYKRMDISTKLCVPPHSNSPGCSPEAISSIIYTAYVLLKYKYVKAQSSGFKCRFKVCPSNINTFSGSYGSSGFNF